MKLSINDTASKKFTCIVDDGLIRSIDNAATSCGLNRNCEVSARCSNKRKYEFESITEFLDAANSEFLDIVWLRLGFREDGPYWSGPNRFELEFDANATIIDNRVSVTYQFSDEAKYLQLKEKVDRILASSKSSYSALTHFPLIAVLLSITFFALFPITWAYSIVFPKIAQWALWIVWGLGSAASFFLYTSSGRHRAFPLVDFRIGQMRREAERKDAIRSKVIWGVVVAFVVGVLAGVVGSFASGR